MKRTIPSILWWVFTSSVMLFLLAILSICTYHSIYDIEFHRPVTIHTIGQCVTTGNNTTACIGTSNGAIMESKYPMIPGKVMYQMCSLSPSGRTGCNAKLDKSTNDRMTEIEARRLYNDGR